MSRFVRRQLQQMYLGRVFEAQNTEVVQIGTEEREGLAVNRHKSLLLLKYRRRDLNPHDPKVTGF